MSQPTESMRRKRTVLLRVQGARCFYCNRWLSWSDATLDHMIARSRGGRDSIDNLVACCFQCNQSKGDAEPTLEEWERKVEHMRRVPRKHLPPELRDVVPCY